MSIRSQITGNIIKSYFIMFCFVMLVIGISYVFSQGSGYGNTIVVYGIIISLISSFVSFFWGDSIVLAMSQARPATRKKDFNFFTVTENLAIAGGMPKPKLFVIEDSAINAFAAGRDPHHAAVCVTSGLLQRLDRREIEGVVAHELSHIRNYDMRLMVIVAVLVGTIIYASDFFLRNIFWRGSRDRDERSGSQSAFILIGIILAIVTPLLATLIQLSMSRQREFLADASAALLTRYPKGLANALEKISQDKEILRSATNGTAHLFITNPFKQHSFASKISHVFDTHPPIEERIRILRAM